jgi:hypothetical protein
MTMTVMDSEAYQTALHIEKLVVSGFVHCPGEDEVIVFNTSSGEEFEMHFNKETRYFDYLGRSGDGSTFNPYYKVQGNQLESNSSSAWVKKSDRKQLASTA